MPTRRFVTVLLLIAAGGLAVRVVWILGETRHRNASVDETFNYGSAIVLARGDGFTTPPLFGAPGQPFAEHPPLTTLVLAPAAALANDSRLVMRLTMACIGAGAIALVGALGRTLAGARAGLIAAAIAALYPNLWVNDGLLMAETLAATCTAMVVWCAYRLLRTPTYASAAAAGVAAGLAMLARAELALLVPVVVIPTALVARGAASGRRLRIAAAAVVTAAVVVMPWVAYNMSRFERPVFLSTGDGGVLAGANCDQTYAGAFLGSWFGLCHADLPQHLEPSIESSVKRRRALQYARDHVGRLPVVVTARIGRTWGVFRPFQGFATDGETRPRWVIGTAWAAYWTLAALAIAGACVLRRRGVVLWPLIGPIVVITIAVATFHGTVRYRAAVEVCIVVLAAVALDTATRRHVLHEYRPVP